jgi:hypothetical protein
LNLFFSAFSGIESIGIEVRANTALQPMQVGTLPRQCSGAATGLQCTNLQPNAATISAA